MKHILFLVVFIPQIWADSSSAESADSYTSSSLRLSSERFCGSGVAIDGGRILTNAHVVRSICDQTECPQLTISQTAGSDSGKLTQVPTKHVAVEQVFDGIDIAVLAPSPPLEMTAHVANAAPAIEEEISVVGYPGCESRRISKGRVLGRESLYLRSSITGDYGSSGSPVFNSKGEFVGIVDESASIFGAIIGHALTNGQILRTIRGDVIESLIQAPEAERKGVEAALIYSFYQQEVLGVTGFSRLSRSLDFLSSVQSFKRGMLQQNLSGKERGILLLLNEPLSYWNLRSLENLSDSENKLLDLVTSATVERYGISTALSGEAPKNVSSIYERASAERYPGFEPMLLSLQISTSVLGILLGILWGISLGYVFRDGSGGFVRRIFITAAVGFFLWPISLLFYSFWPPKKAAKD